MKIKFTETTYDLVTRDLVDARLEITLMKGGKTVEEIEAEIRASEGITILNDDESEVVTYTGFTDVIVIKDYDKAISFVLINNFLLQETMALASRVSDLEGNTASLNERTETLEQNDTDFNESQDNQDTIIADLLEMEG